MLDWFGLVWLGWVAVRGSWVVGCGLWFVVVMVVVVVVVVVAAAVVVAVAAVVAAATIKTIMVNQ